MKQYQNNHQILQTQEPMESFTMSVDRGFLGRTPGDRDPGQYRSMDDLAVQKTTGLELVRLLRVKNSINQGDGALFKKDRY